VKPHSWATLSFSGKWQEASSKSVPSNKLKAFTASIFFYNEENLPPTLKQRKKKEFQYSYKQKVPNFTIIELKMLNPKFYKAKSFKLSNEIVIWLKKKKGTQKFNDQKDSNFEM
jgi:hypothetical protein